MAPIAMQPSTLRSITLVTKLTDAILTLFSSPFFSKLILKRAVSDGALCFRKPSSSLTIWLGGTHVPRRADTPASLP
ncbi:hypothetical protein DES52_11871 [Deinococcus yavapaiensis KR-236]|uniref:Uncharacterized protein n=1 Tax=Deinococcus yavapaiensis KR-236 TaxID=694435 RepID=A0A318S1U3_9DEIO|nr:hypothetical protein DES52_11871 [Deinococcus yavapaiensis KR-236]